MDGFAIQKSQWKGLGVCWKCERLRFSMSWVCGSISYKSHIGPTR